MESDKTIVRECPFGIDARHCEHQETRAKDLMSAVKGELVFLCTLDKLENCPKMKELLNSVLEDKSDNN